MEYAFAAWLRAARAPPRPARRQVGSPVAGGRTLRQYQRVRCDGQRRVAYHPVVLAAFPVHGHHCNATRPASFGTCPEHSAAEHIVSGQGGWQRYLKMKPFEMTDAPGRRACWRSRRRISETRQAWRIAGYARCRGGRPNCGYPPYSGCLLEKSIGAAAHLQIFAGLRDLAWGCEHFGAQTLTGNLETEPLSFADSHIRLPTGPGLSVTLDPEQLRRYARQ
jgi:hypothetical protein